MVRLAIACAALAVLLTGCAVQDDPGCAGDDVITPICGFLPPEDVEVVPGGEALVVGGFSLDNKNGDQIIRVGKAPRSVPLNRNRPIPTGILSDLAGTFNRFWIRMDSMDQKIFQLAQSGYPLSVPELDKDGQAAFQVSS